MYQSIRAEIMKRQIDLNAKRAFEEMKLEIANELDIKLADLGNISGTMIKELAEIGQRQLSDEKMEDFDPK
ncbi:MAG TPA: small, acid-soluble spore protein, alpha/beta type [Tissierellaceae bacterium]|nr:small, acid-soluble spore protein, alpha/beta type [Tissierellaceae bacterium]